MSESHEYPIDVDAYAALLEQRGLENSFPVLKAILSKGSSVLDVGCGPATVTVDVARMVHPGKVIGVDLLPEMVERARGYGASQQLENLTIRQGNTYELDLADNSFDITYSLNVLVHLTDPVR